MPGQAERPVEFNNYCTPQINSRTSTLLTSVGLQVSRILHQRIVQLDEARHACADALGSLLSLVDALEPHSTSTGIIPGSTTSSTTTTSTSTSSTITDISLNSSHEFASALGQS